MIGSMNKYALWRRHSDAVNIRLLHRWLKPAKTDAILKTDLFDESSSTGIYPALALYAKTIVGIDIAEPVIRAAADQYPEIRAVPADVRAIPFKDAQFDAIFSNSTLDHFTARSDIETSIGELGRVLKNNGILIITLDNISNPVVALRNALPSNLLRRFGILPYFIGKSVSAAQLHEMLRKAGFRIIKTEYILHAPRIFAVAASRLLQAIAGKKIQDKFLSFLMRWEGLSQLPAQSLTGYFTAVKAVKNNAIAP